MFAKLLFFKCDKKKVLNKYSNFQLLTDVHVPATEVVWHRIHGECPREVAKEGFRGRKKLPVDNLKSYIGLNTKFGGFGGTICTEKALEFAKKGANNLKNFLYSSINPNKKISIPAFIRQTTDELSESTATSKIGEMEVMALGDVTPEFIFYATDEFDKFAEGEEVENLLHCVNPNLPSLYRSSDVATPASILLHLAKTGNMGIIAEGIEKQIFDVEEMSQLAQQPEYSKLATLLDYRISKNIK
ncbi:TPA: hypothetical protein ACTXXA_000719 [Legionella anisa]